MALLAQQSVTISIMVNGSCAALEIDPDTPQEEVIAQARQVESVSRFLRIAVRRRWSMSRTGRSTSLSAELKRTMYRHCTTRLRQPTRSVRTCIRQAGTAADHHRAQERKRRVTPLQYEELDGKIYVTAAYGLKADWVRNILADPCVEARIKQRRFRAALVITDPERIADMLELRLKRHPRMIGMILRMERLPAKPAREDLTALASKLAMVEITPGVELNH